MKRKNFCFYLLPLTLLILGFFIPFTAHAAIESTVHLSIEKGITYKLELPTPARGYIDKSTWTTDCPDIVFLDKSLGYAHIKSSYGFSGTAKVECLYVAKWYDSIGGSRADTYLRTWEITCVNGGGDDPSEIILSVTPATGSYKKGTEISIKSNIPESYIRYTTDGTDPRSSNTSIKGNKVSNMTTKLNFSILKAYAFAYNAGGVKIETDVITENYTFDTSDQVEIITKEGVTIKGEYINNRKEISLTNYHTPVIDKNIKGSITIPQSWNGIPITEIGDYAFSECAITDIVLPEGLRRVEENAFYKNEITTITLPSTLAYAGPLSFCIYSLNSIFCKPIDPPTGAKNIYTTVIGAFPSLPEAVLYVPKGSKSKYMNAKGWNEFQHIEEFDYSDVNELILNESTSTIYYDLKGSEIKEPHSGEIYIKKNGNIQSKIIFK